ncbi:MAG: restriction endonuclease subunit S [Bacteroidetes bacterium]|nr:restriction endonuclease subunit S [Bacteroidota bacterium]
MEKELPIGWVETNLDMIVVQKKGKKPLKLEPVEFKNSVPYLDIHALEKGIYRQYAEIKSSNLMDENMIAIVWDGARSGWVSKGKFGAIGSTLAALKPINVDINYVFYYLQSNFSLINTNPRGIGIPHVDPTLLWNLSVPLPPLPEQQRMVAKLDTLFEHLDALKNRLDRIPQLLKDFRQKVLTQAVTGKLTEEWREGRELAEWKTEALGNVLKDVKYGTSKKSEYETIGTPILRIPNIKNGEIDISDLKFSILDDKEYDSLKLDEGDILIIRSNGSVSLVGQSAIIRKNLEGYSYAGYLIRLRVKKSLFPDYLNYALESHSLREQIVETARSTSGVNNINSQEIKDLIISYPPIEEQQEIVRRVESLFAKADQIEASYQKLTAKIEQLPQALLAKAFRGELVEQLPTDGDSRELLEQIKQAKAGLEKGGKIKKMKGDEETRMVAEGGSRYGLRRI